MSENNEIENIEDISNRKSAMRILAFLVKMGRPYFVGEIADNLNINYSAAYDSIYKLESVGLVEFTRSDVDHRLRYVKVRNRHLVDRSIERYRKRVGFQLARLIPYEHERVTLEQVKQDKRFMSCCDEFGITLVEGIKATLEYPFVTQGQTFDNRVFVFRNRQGSDEPEKPKPQVEEV